MKYDVFISYSRKDSLIAGQIYEALSAAGLSCFIDREGISGGADFTKVITVAIMESRLLLFLASENAFSSEYTQKEITFAINQKGSHFILPLKIDKKDFPENLAFLLSDINYRELSSRYRIQKELVEDVQHKLANPHAGETIRQRGRRTFSFLLVTAIVLFMIVVGLLLWIWNGNRNQRIAEQQRRERAERDQLTCEQLFAKANNAKQSLDSLDNVGLNRDNVLQRTLFYQDAISALDVIDSLYTLYHNDFDYKSHFEEFSRNSTGRLRQDFERRRINLQSLLTEKVEVNYDYYSKDKSPDNRDALLYYLDMAKIACPEDSTIITKYKELQ